MASSQEHGPAASSHEEETYSEATMSADAAGAAVASANQSERLDAAKSATDELLDEIDQYLEEESVVLDYRQKNGE